MVNVVNQLLSISTILAQALIFVVIFSWVILRNTDNAVTKWVSKNGLWIAFVAALVATLGSLFYSEIAGYDPCKLCWIQRIFMYPQVILFGIALWKKDMSVALYGIVLSVIGAIIAFYHYLLQVGLIHSTNCEVVGYSAACSQRFLMHYGYITIPMMALTAFGLIIVSLSAMRKLNK